MPINTQRRKLLSVLVASSLLNACGTAERRPASTSTTPSANPGPALSQGGFRFIKASEGQLQFEGGEPAVLRGFAFGNEVYSDNRLPYTHHDERDYARLKAMGMNLVRFYLHYQTFESDAAPYHYQDDGWQWLDRNIAWARAHGIYLILNMHAPQGGYQSTGKGSALWQEPENQRRLTALWRAIAQRYANEPVIAGYDLLNEPVVTHQQSQWQDLAQGMARAIREVDSRHLIIVERVNAVAGSWRNNEAMNFVTIDDPNVAYTFHFYEPFDYTHQYAEWIASKRNREGGPYPSRDWTRNWLRTRLNAYLDWGRTNKVALYLGEFGCIRACFEHERGGLNWAADVADLASEAGLPWTYHAWHEDNFGLYLGYGELPNPAHANQAMIELFTRKFAHQPSPT